jgi:hypothetical protein
MAYVTQGQSSLGCSVKELMVGTQPTVQELQQMLHDGVTVVVTSSQYQGPAEQVLREAGFVPLMEYPNHAAGHAGNMCKLWAAVKRRANVKVLPERKKFPLRKRSGGAIVDKALERARALKGK